MDYKIFKIGIASFEEYKKRTLAIAKGEYKPLPDEPKIWFESSQSVTNILRSSDCDFECDCSHHTQQNESYPCAVVA